MVKQRMFYAFLAIYVLLMFSLLVTMIRDGSLWRVVALMWLASPLLLAALALIYENATLREVFDLKYGSWAFLLGDTIALPAAAVFASLAWHSLPSSGWWGASSWWTTLSLLVGIAAGATFHLNDRKAYIKAGAKAALASPTKGGHDGGAYPTLFGGLFCVGVPLLFNWSWHVAAMLACLLLWLAFGIADLRRGLDPHRLHPLWDKRKFAVARPRRS